jgi:preprotein translocase subunit SecF
MRFLKETNIDFMGLRGWAFALSAAMILISLGSVYQHHGLRYSIDFAGGSVLQMKFAETVAVDEVRRAMGSVGLQQAEIQRFGAPDEMLIRIPETGDATAVDRAKTALTETFAGAELRREERVGPKVGSELRRSAINSILLSLGLILAYITIRFEFRFAVGAIVALAHDVTITVGALSLIGHEMSLVTIAALLTIVGFSINDTIVVYDRIRENLRVPSREALDKVLNKSINQVLGRTIITSGTVLLSTIILMIFGGKVLWDLAFALTVGVTVGTYSSDFIATPLVYEWERRWPKRAKGGPRPAPTGQPVKAKPKAKSKASSN